MQPLPPLRMFVYSTFCEYQQRHADFLTAGAIKIGSTARLLGYEMQVIYADSIELTPAVLSNNMAYVVGELYAVTKGCLAFADSIIRPKCFDRVCVAIKYWGDDNKEHTETAWTYVSTATAIIGGRKIHSIAELGGTDASRSPFVRYQ